VAVALMLITSHHSHWVEVTVMSLLSLESQRVHHLRHHELSSHEWIWECKWVILAWSLRSALTAEMAVALVSWSWRWSGFGFNCLFFKFLLFLLLFVHNNIVRDIIDIESSISCPWLGVSLRLSIETVDLWLEESILVLLLWCFIVHLLLTLSRVEALL
jgi:hypothetical protein